MNDKAITPYEKLRKLMSGDEVQAKFKEILGERAPAFVASVINTVYTNDNLKNCDPNSVFVCAVKAAVLDLPVDPNLGFSWIIPYKNEATFQIGYKGYIQLAIRTGQYEAINAAEIYEGEKVVVDRLTGKVRLNGKRTGDEIVGYVSYFKLLNGFEKFIYMSTEEVHKHAKQYSKSYGSASSAWSTAFPEMAKKTVIRKLLSKFGLLSISLVSAFKEDNDLTDIPLEESDIIDGRFATPDLDMEVKSLPLVDELVDLKLCQNKHSSANLIEKLGLENVEHDEAIKMARGYRAWRDMGDTSDKAAESILAGKYPK